jgi:heat-inducible transcriptional repressor
MGPTDRQKKILRAIVDCYVRTAEPVGSKAIAEMPEMGFSSATIRNEMAALTELGLLEQPHTSAGRIPSPAGYRLYVDELMQDYRLSTDETRSLNQAMEIKMQEFDKVMGQIGKLVSQLTDLPAYTVASHTQRPTVRRFEILEAGNHSFILVVMTNAEVVRNKLIKLPLEVGEQDLRMLSAVLNASLTELSVDEFTPALIERVIRSAGPASSLIPVVVDFTTELLNEQQHSEVFLTGQTKLLDQPEYQDISKAQELLSTLDEEMISNLPVPAGQDGTRILVGPENVAKELKDTSVVMTQFDVGDGMKGMIGVVGPTRMDYAKVTARLSYFAEGLAKMFGKTELPPPNEEE